MSLVRDNLAWIKERINDAARRAGRDPDEVRLVAVSKRIQPELINEAFAGGQRLFGENYLQEAAMKIASLDKGIVWHFIGHLQSNKGAQVAELFDMVETVDRLKVAQVLDRNLAGQGRVLPVLIEVNIGREARKSGVMPEDAVPLLQAMQGLQNLSVNGLMVMPPYSPDQEMVRPYFRQTRELALRLQDMGLLARENRPELSMGMSGDFEAAVEEGGTLVRVGTALFGPRS